MAMKIEANISSCRVDPFYSLRAKVDIKEKIGDPEYICRMK
jgi:hypothetical protein